MLDGATDLFGVGKKKSNEEELEAQKDKLHAKIGQLAVEVDFLRKNQNSSVCEESYRAGGKKAS